MSPMSTMMRDCMSSIAVLEAALLDAEVAGDAHLVAKLNSALFEQQIRLGDLIDAAVGLAPAPEMQALS